MLELCRNSRETANPLRISGLKRLACAGSWKRGTGKALQERALAAISVRRTNPNYCSGWTDVRPQSSQRR